MSDSDNPAPPAGNGAYARAVAPILTAAEAHEAVRQGVQQANGMKSGPGNVVGRTLPHSIEAEEHLLSCCLLDGADMVGRCLEAKVGPWSFYDSKHGLVFETLMRMYDAKTPIDAATLAEELRDRRTLDRVGGYAFITQVSSRAPTTIQADYFIAKVREQATLREIIRESTRAVEDCYTLSGDVEGLGTDIIRRLDAVVGRGAVSKSQRMDWDELIAFNPKVDPDCLMGNRFLGRTSGFLVVAPSGVGKSVLGLQLSADAALMRHFFGMRMHVAMRVLYIQAEDDFGDVAEAVQGFLRGHDLTADEHAQLKIRLRIERWNDVSGQAFLSQLRGFYKIWPFDLVMINPLFAFCGCNVSDQEKMSIFLRNGLNPILNDTRSAAGIIHHTNKPPQDAAAQDKAMEAELRYLGSGSSEITNWARAYITLQGVRTAAANVHKMVFVKRGNRTGIVDEEGKPTHSVYIEHSKTGLCWLPSDYTPEVRPGGKFIAKFDLSRALGIYDSSKSWAENERAIASGMDMDRRSISRHRQAILDNA